MNRCTEKLKPAIAVSTVAALAVGGCAVVGSAPTFEGLYDVREGPNSVLDCRSTLGSYTLPKRVLTVKIAKKDGDSFYTLDPDIYKPIPIPDNQHTFCLDHLRSPLASDEVRVFKNKIKELPASEQTGTPVRRYSAKNEENTPFLQLIASKAVDHTAGIVRRFLRAAFILITNKKDFTSARAAVGTKTSAETIVLNEKVDPFDYREMASINQRMRKYGFCLVLEDYTFDDSGSATPGQYCNSPEGVAGLAPPRSAQAIRELRYLVQKPVHGIFFRPRASYRLSIYLKDDPGGRGSWRPGPTTNVVMENIMPIVSVGVDRALFAVRRTGLVFDDGLLMNVCIAKGSEIEGFIKIPLDVIYGIIALPSEMVIAAIDDAKTSIDLMKAKNTLIEAQNNYIKFLAGTDKDRSKLAGGTKGSLSLGNKNNPTFAAVEAANETEFGPPTDAGAIADDAVLADICPQLLATRTSSAYPNTTAGKGDF